MLRRVAVDRLTNGRAGSRTVTETNGGAAAGRDRDKTYSPAAVGRMEGHKRHEWAEWECMAPHSGVLSVYTARIDVYGCGCLIRRTLPNTIQPDAATANGSSPSVLPRSVRSGLAAPQPKHTTAGPREFRFPRPTAAYVARPRQMSDASISRSAAASSTQPS